MANFVQVPAGPIEDWLQKKGFERTVQRQEVVYVRRSRRDRAVQLKVYTSIRLGQQAVRGRGKDAIRVCVVFDNGRRSFGIGKFSPVFRVTSTESVLRRLEERLRSAALRGNEWMDRNSAQYAPAPAPREPDEPPQSAFMGEGGDDFNAEWARLKNENARQEAEAESAAYAAEMEAELRANNVCPQCMTQRCPDGCCCAC